MSSNHTGGFTTDNEEHRSVNGVNTKATTTYGFDGQNLVPEAANGNMAIKQQIVGNITYMGFAAAGTPQASALWKAMKIDQTSGLLITWADGNPNFDNVATDLTTLTYS